MGVQRIARAVSTLGPLGKSRFAPGTVGAATAAAVAYAAAGSTGNAVVILAVLVTLAGQWAVVARGDGDDDPSEVVIDEAAGQLVALMCLRPDIVHVGAALILFRLLDIWKPWPIRAVERRGGAWAVMGDDIVAGCLARVLLFGVDACV